MDRRRAEKTLYEARSRREFLARVGSGVLLANNAPASLVYDPVFYGIEDIAPRNPSFRARIYYPSQDGAPVSAPIYRGKYPIVLFVHGFRAEGQFCTADVSRDYTRWRETLGLLARCGFVVVSPDVSGHLSSQGVDENSIGLLISAVDWLREKWIYRDMLSPSAIGLIGHSWGAGHLCGGLLARKYPAAAFASIAGVWDEEAADGVIGAGIPTLFTSGTADFPTAGPTAQLYEWAPRPKHEAVLQGVDHWGFISTIRDCFDPFERGCPAAPLMTSELVLTFFAKYMLGMWYLAPHLLTRPGLRPPVLPYFESSSGCGLKVRWEVDDPDPSRRRGEITVGNWTGVSPWRD